MTPGSRPGWIVWTSAALGYLVLAALATWPVVTRFGAELPGELTDPLEHLWLMRWLRSCLIEGRNPLFCPEIQAPVGVPLGYFPTMHLQTVLYILGRLVTGNDTAIFTTIWFLGFVTTGLASMALARWAVPGCPHGVAWVAGLGMMLCGPMLMHAHGHLETMQMGVVPPFLIAWIRLVDAPSRRGLLGAILAYWLVVAAAPYFAVLAIFPAVWYLGWSLLTSAREERWPRSRRLAPWLVGFGLVVLPGAATLFGGQVWAGLHGWPMTRSKREFNHLGAPVWSSLVPSPRHLMGRLTFPDIFEQTGFAGRMSEVSSYLGLVVSSALFWGAWRRVDFPRRGYWWSVLAVMVVLSWGARQEIFGAHVSLPAGWIYDLFPPFHLIRVPARFNLFAAAVAVVPVAATLRGLLSKVRSRWGYGLVLASLTGLTLADLAMVPFGSAPIPEPPAVYAQIRQANPHAVILDAPLFDSSQGQTFSSLWGYWQQVHGLRTSAGYPGLTNAQFDAEIVRPSCFSARQALRLKPDQLPIATAADFDLDGTQDIKGRVWLELTAHGFDHVVEHANHTPDLGTYSYWSWTVHNFILGGDLNLPAYKVDLLDRAMLPLPNHLVWMSDRGWREVPGGGENATQFAALAEARVEVYQPTDRPVVLTLAGVDAFARTRVVRLVEGDRELALWRIEPGTRRDIQSGPIPLTVGRHTWTLISDGADRPTRSADRIDLAGTPYSFRLAGVRLRVASPTSKD